MLVLTGETHDGLTSAQTVTSQARDNISLEVFRMSEEDQQHE